MMKTPFGAFFYGTMLLMLKKRNNKIKFIVATFILISTGFSVSTKAEEITKPHLKIQDEVINHRTGLNLDYFTGLVHDTVKSVKQEQATVQKQVHETEKAAVPPSPPVKTREEKLIETANLSLMFMAARRLMALTVLVLHRMSIGRHWGKKSVARLGLKCLLVSKFRLKRPKSAMFSYFSVVTM